MRLHDDPRSPAPAFLRRRSGLPVWADLAWRVALIVFMVAIVLIVHWVERDGLKDNLDNRISFIDVLYFTTVTVTTVGYGDIVPVSDGTRLFETFIVTPIRIFVWLVFLGTAYHFVFRNTWHRWRMARIQQQLKGHIVLLGFGTSGAEAARELIARGIQPEEMVVVDRDEGAIAQAEAMGCNVLNGDATRDHIQSDIRVSQARAIIISAGRDDTSILMTLTARHLAPNVPISVVVRATDNELLAAQAGATTVINPASFAGLLLAGSSQGMHIAQYLADLANADGRVNLAERDVRTDEIGLPLSAITTGLGVRIYRQGQPIGFDEAGAKVLQPGDCIVEIIRSHSPGSNSNHGT
ncbi:MAG: potassium channel family protein [Sphingobium sp.]